MTARRWHRVSLRVPQAALDAVANFLVESGSSGTVEEARAPGTPQPAETVVQGFFPEETNPADLRARLDRYLRSVAVEYPALTGCAPKFDVISSAAWQDHWKAHFPPLPVGRRLLILPPWEPPPDASERIPIVINPGQAFGTGHHATTKTCLEAIERRCTTAAGPPTRALDLGTGSGVLAIALAKLGVPEVWATDTDPDARREAHRNAERNRVADVRISAADVSALRGPFHLVVANIFATTLIALHPELTRLVSRTGHAILSGIESDQTTSVLEAFCEPDWTLHERIVQDDWATLVLRRR